MYEPTQQDLVAGVKIVITPHEVGEDPPIVVFHVLIEDVREKTRGVWTDRFGSKELLQAYLRGLEAGAAMIGKTHMLRPEIPFSGY